MAELIDDSCPGHKPAVALDEWNVKLPPPPGAASMHVQNYTQRDALYVAGMLNAFHRTAPFLKLANIAMLVNVLPLIIKEADKAAAFTPLAFPFILYRRMEKIALECGISSPGFHAAGLGLNIRENEDAPWIDAAATRDESAGRLVIGIINRHPTRRARVQVECEGLAGLEAVKFSTLSVPGGKGPLRGDPVITESSPPKMNGAELRSCSLVLPPASLGLIECEGTALEAGR